MGYFFIIDHCGKCHAMAEPIRRTYSATHRNQGVDLRNSGCKSASMPMNSLKDFEDKIFLTTYKVVCFKQPANAIFHQEKGASPYLHDSATFFGRGLCKNISNAC